MAKSDENPNSSIALLDDADTVRRKIKRAVTDSGTEIRFDEQKPALMNLLTIYQILTRKTPPEIEAHFAGKGYAQLKGELADVVVEFLQPFQERARGISDEELDRILEMGRERASLVARPTIENVKTRMGLHGAHA
jgi:tryptophanyl-tRNA synthetase